MKVSSEDIKKLRQMTGAGILDCKNVLQESNGDIDEAIKSLRKTGAIKAAQKGDRATREGIIESYIHFNKRVGVLVEVNCETDFVARNERFTEFCHELGIHVAAYDPRWLSPEDVPEEVLNDEKEIFREQLKRENKPDNIIEKIIQGKLKKFYEKHCLLKQKYSGNDKITVEQAAQELIQATGENVQIARFARFALGD